MRAGSISFLLESRQSGVDKAEVKKQEKYPPGVRPIKVLQKGGAG